MVDDSTLLDSLKDLPGMHRNAAYMTLLIGVSSAPCPQFPISSRVKRSSVGLHCSSILWSMQAVNIPRPQLKAHPHSPKATVESQVTGQSTPTSVYSLTTTLFLPSFRGTSGWPRSSLGINNINSGPHIRQVDSDSPSKWVLCTMYIGLWIGSGYADPRAPRGATTARMLNPLQIYRH